MWRRTGIVSAGVLGFLVTVSPINLDPKAHAVPGSSTQQAWAGYIGKSVSYNWSPRLFEARVFELGNGRTDRIDTENTVTRTARSPDDSGLGLTLAPDWSLEVDYQFLSLESLSAFEVLADGAVPDAARKGAHPSRFELSLVGKPFSPEATVLAGALLGRRA